MDLPGWQHAGWPATQFSGTAADVDGNGVADLVALAYADLAGHPSGVYVAFRGRGPLTSFADGDVGTSGVRITSDSPVNEVASLGDLDGDGRDEIAVRTSEEVAVVRGRSEPGTVDVSAPGDWGLTLRSSYGSGWDIGYSPGWPIWRGIAGVGDQNADGRRDIAVSFAGWRAFVVHSPADLRGEVRVIDQLGTGGYELQLDSGSGVSVFAMDDVDGDGRREIGVATRAYDWEDPASSSTHAWVVRPQAAGTVLHLPGAAASGEAFEAVLHGAAYLQNAFALGDQDGDGLREVALAISKDEQSWLYVPFTGELGTTLDLGSMGPSQGYRMQGWGSVDAGDQDGDGRADVADGGSVWITDERARSGAPYDSDRQVWHLPQGDTWPSIVASVPDTNGDGRAELATIASSHAYDADGTVESGSYGAGVWYSDAAPELLWASARYAQDRAQIGGQVRVGRASSGGIAATVEIAGSPWWANTEVRDDGTVVFGTEAWLAPGTHDVRVIFRDGRGRTVQWRGSVTVPEYVPPPPAGWPYPAPWVYPPGQPPPFPWGDRGPRIGTAGADRLKGTPWNDLMRGRRGDDRLWGLGAKDVVYGEAGDDRLWGGKGDDTLMGDEGRDRVVGGPGQDHLYGDLGGDVIIARDGDRDIVRCGGGTDRAVVDRVDALSRCERVRITRARRP